MSTPTLELTSHTPAMAPTPPSVDIAGTPASVSSAGSRRMTPASSTSASTKRLSVVGNSTRVLPVTDFDVAAQAVRLRRLHDLPSIKRPSSQAASKQAKSGVALPTLNPSHTALPRWNLVVAAAVLFSAILGPFTLAFGVATPTTAALDSIMHTILLLDVVAVLNTAILVDGVLVRDHVAILKAYARSSLFTDLMYALPLNYMVAHPISHSIVVLRILRLYRFRTLFVFVRPVVRASIVFLLALLIVHWCGCLWFAVSHASSSWAEPGVYATTWLESAGLEHASTSVQYIASVYWAASTISSVGYGDLHATNGAEQLCAVAIIVMGTILVQSVLLGTFTALIGSTSHQDTLYLAKMDALAGELEDMKAPRALRKQVMNFYAFQWDRRRHRDAEGLMDELPLALRSNLAELKHQRMVCNSPAFSDPALVQMLALLLAPLVSTPDEVLFERGDACTHMFFVRSGEVVLQDEDGTTVSHRRSGAYFGDMGLFEDKGPEYRVTAVSVTHCELYCVEVEAFLRVLDMHPEARTRLSAIASRRGDLASIGQYADDKETQDAVLEGMPQDSDSEESSSVGDELPRNLETLEEEGEEGEGGEEPPQLSSRRTCSWVTGMAAASALPFAEDLESGSRRLSTSSKRPHTARLSVSRPRTATRSTARPNTARGVVKVPHISLPAPPLSARGSVVSVRSPSRTRMLRAASLTQLLMTPQPQPPPLPPLPSVGSTAGLLSPTTARDNRLTKLEAQNERILYMLSQLQSRQVAAPGI